MKKNLTTELVFLLDRSGSMHGCQQAAVDSFNHFLADQQKTAGHARLTLALFDHEYLLPIRALPVAEILPLDEAVYIPRGTTALLDAIGRTIEDLARRLAAIPPGRRPVQVIIAILTDGLENASEHYTWRDIAALIKRHTEEDRWTFLFLGANQDAIATAAQLHIAAANAANYIADDAGTAAGTSALSRKMRALRRSSARARLAPAEKADLHAPMNQIVEDENKKRRDPASDSKK